MTAARLAAKSQMPTILPLRPAVGISRSAISPKRKRGPGREKSGESGAVGGSCGPFRHHLRAARCGCSIWCCGLPPSKPKVVSKKIISAEAAEAWYRGRQLAVSSRVVEIRRGLTPRMRATGAPDAAASALFRPMFRNAVF